MAIKKQDFKKLQFYTMEQNDKFLRIVYFDYEASSTNKMCTYTYTHIYFSSLKRIKFQL